MKPVKKAVFPVGGMGTRFLPATKAVPKEMLPVVDRPLLQYAVDEALAAGIDQMIFVTARGKGALEDYFDIAGELVATLKERGKSAELAVLDETQLAPGQIAYVRQQEPSGLGPCGVVRKTYHRRRAVCRSVAGRAVVEPRRPLPRADGSRPQRSGRNRDRSCGSARDRDPPLWHRRPRSHRWRAYRSEGFRRKAESRNRAFAAGGVGRYLIEPECMAILGEGKRGAGGEIQLTDALAQLIGKQPFHAFTYAGARFDCGDKAGHVTANIALALERPDIGPTVRAWLAANLS
jgi:UTP--glucose-1-phosphate uridylyltransferase